jgi:DNA-binding CsgD family transcriptional regulator
MEAALGRRYESEDVLTSREREIVRHVAFGLHNAEVATRLDISAGTVRKHLEHVFRKLGVRRRSELSGYALRSGIV